MRLRLLALLTVVTAGALAAPAAAALPHATNCRRCRAREGPRITKRLVVPSFALSKLALAFRSFEISLTVAFSIAL